MRGTIVGGHGKKKPFFRRMKNPRVRSIETDADVKRYFAAALLDERIDDSMLTAASEDERTSYGSDTSVMMTIATSVAKGLNVD